MATPPDLLQRQYQATLTADMVSLSSDKINPPGQTRSYPDSTSTGKVAWEDAKRGIKVETSYKLWGDLNGDKTPLICLHGGPGVPHQYLLPICLVHVDHGTPVLMYDQVGCGESTRFKDKKLDKDFCTVDLFMAELDHVKTALGIQHFDLLGQSWGGMLAGEYAISQPKNLRKLVIADSPASMPGWVKAGDKFRAQLPKDVKEVLDRCEREDKTDSKEYEKAVEYYYSLYLCRREPMPKELTDSFGLLAEDNTVYLTMNGPNEFHVIGTLKEWSIIDELHKITPETCPGGMLIVNGFYDQASDESTGPFFYRPSCKVKWVRFPISAHVPMLEETEAFMEALGTFLVTD